MIYYFIGSASNWTQQSSWATFSAGTPLTASRPGVGDVAIFDSNSGSCNYDTSTIVDSVDFTNYSKTFSFTEMPNYLIINKSLDLGASMDVRYLSSGGVNYSFSTSISTAGGFFLLPITQSSYSTASVKTNNKYLNGLITFGFRFTGTNTLTSNTSNIFSVELLDTLNCDSIALYGSATNNNTIFLSSGTLSFTGSYGFNTNNLLCLSNIATSNLNLSQSGKYILNSGITYSVNSRLVINAIIGTRGNVILSSSIANQPAFLTVANGAVISISQTDIIDINSSGGKTIRIYNGTPTRCNNIVNFNYTDLQPFVSGFTL